MHRCSMSSPRGVSFHSATADGWSIARKLKISVNVKEYLFQKISKVGITLAGDDCRLEVGELTHVGDVFTGDAHSFVARLKFNFIKIKLLKFLKKCFYKL